MNDPVSEARQLLEAHTDPTMVASVFQEVRVAPALLEQLCGEVDRLRAVLAELCNNEVRPMGTTSSWYAKKARAALEGES